MGKRTQVASPREARRALGYRRVSTEMQAESGLGLEAQDAAIRFEVERRGWELVGVLTDTASGGSREGRPELQRALIELAEARADVLVVAKLDRLSRSLRDFVKLTERAEQERWSLVALDSPIDMTDPYGEAQVGMMAVFAQLECRLISRRTKDALAAARARGVVLGRPSQVPLPIVARIVRERRLQLGLQFIADSLTADDVPTARHGERWWPSTVHGVLRSQVARRLQQLEDEELFLLAGLEDDEVRELLENDEHHSQEA